MHGFDNRGLYAPAGSFAVSGRFGRMFPAAPCLQHFHPGPEALGAVDGPMDGGLTPPDDTSQDNTRIKAGYTFLGQFIDHDITLDATSILERQIDVDATHNFRTPALELDSLYGRGPDMQPYLYEPDGMRFMLSEDAGDLPRNRHGRALIGDHRNDENLIISQLHLLFLKFHNRVVESQTDPDASAGERFLEAQTIVRRHYQWIVLHDFLERTIGKAVVDALRAHNPFTYAPDVDPFIPVEFSVAAFRFGHSQARSGYALREGVGGLLFPAPGTPAGAPDMRGFKPVPPERAIDWAFFFGGEPQAQAGMMIDTKIATPMLNLPDGVVPGAPRSVATRNLQRGIDARLPSGQVAAEVMLPPAERLNNDQIWSAAGGHGPAPLWYYILREAEVMTGGTHLAGVGAQIVGRTFLALLTHDPASYLHAAPHWTPTLPRADSNTFTMVDLINFTEGRTIAQEQFEKAAARSREHA